MGVSCCCASCTDRLEVQALKLDNGLVLLGDSAAHFIFGFCFSREVGGIGGADGRFLNGSQDDMFKMVAFGSS